MDNGVNSATCLLPTVDRPARLEWQVQFSPERQTWELVEFDGCRPELGVTVVAVYPVPVGPTYAAPIGWAVALTGVDYPGWTSGPGEHGSYPFHTRTPHPARRPVDGYTCAIVQGPRWLGAYDLAAAMEVAAEYTARDIALYDGQSPARVIRVPEALGLVRG